MHTANRINRRLGGPLTAALLGTVALWVPPAAAQQAGGQQTAGGQVAAAELPPVVVQGATLEAKHPRPARASGPASDDGEPPAKAKKPKKPAATAPAPASAGVPGVEVVSGPQEGTASSGGTAGGVPTDRLGTSVSVVTGEELKNRQIHTVGDALRSLPGVAVSQQGGAGSLSLVRIRGGESRHTLVLIDGVEVNAATDGLMDFANLSTDDVARIEVLRGPQSGIYGSNALSGVVNIITNSGRGPITLRLTGEAGSHNTQGGSLQVSGGTDRAWGSVTLSGRHTDGFNIAPLGHEKDGSRLNTFTFTGGVRPIEGLQIDATWRRSVLTSDFDGFEGWLGGFQVANDNASTSERAITLGRLAATLELLDKHLITTGYVTQGRNNYFADDRGSFASIARTRDETTTYGATSTYRLDGPAGLPVRHFFTGLVEQRHESFDQTSPLATAKDHARTSYAGEARGEYWSHLFLGVGLRHDDNDVFDDYTTWRAQGSLKVPGTVVRLHASGGTGVKYPTFADLYGTYSRYVANPLLKPETSLGWDAGAEATLFGGATIIDVTYFQATLENEFKANFDMWPIITTENLAGTSHRRGIEVSLRQKLANDVVVTAAYTFTDPRDDKGLLETRRPKHSGKVNVDWAFAGGRGRLGVGASYNGTMSDIAFPAWPLPSTTVFLEDYWLVNLTASYKLTPSMELYGRVENILDQHYQDIFGYNATSGVTAYAGVKLTFEDPSTAAWARYRE